MRARKKGEFEGIEENTAQEPRNLWNRIRPRRWNAILQEACKCDAETCGNLHIEFKAFQQISRSCMMLKEVARGLCTGERPLEMKTRLAH